MGSVSSRESDELGEQLVTLMAKCENLEGHVAEKEEEFEETLWRWQDFQSDIDACFRNLAMIEKSLDFQSLDDGELEDRRETHQVRACRFSCQNLRRKNSYSFFFLGPVNTTLEEFENEGFTLKTIKPSTIGGMNLKTQQSPVILDLFLRKLDQTSHMTIVIASFSKSSFFENETPAFLNSPV